MNVMWTKENNMKNQYELTGEEDRNYQLVVDYHSYNDSFDDEVIVTGAPFVGYEGEDDGGNLYAAAWLRPELVIKPT
jgi:hypothetical protein